MKVFGGLNRAIVDREVYLHTDETRKAKIADLLRNTSIALDWMRGRGGFMRLSIICRFLLVNPPRLTNDIW
ncbi:hypothetical protein QUB70_15585 [Microcoleus sp. A003_D6]|uniref:hypothetical protein n=1 Tax=Microcoleus sp. A003_D6 TaxID=3055266 RepID=UPI002FD3B776